MERNREEESSLRGYEYAFERAADELKNAGLAKKVYLSDAQKIKLYGLYKQATEGDCTKSQPSAFQPVERAKWNGWKSLQGMDNTVAKRRYVLQVIELLPSFKMPTGESHGQRVGNSDHNDPVARVATVHSTSGAQQPQQHQSISAPRQERRSVARIGKDPIQQTSVWMILLQLLVFAVLVAGLLLLFIRFALPFAHQLGVEQFGEKDWNAMLLRLTPLSWFGFGYLFVLFLRSRISSWKLLSGNVWLSLVSASRLQQIRTRRRRPRRDVQQTARKTAAFLKERCIHIIREPMDDNDQREMPCLELIRPEDPEALNFGDSTTIIPFALEQTADVYYRKFKEPLPDPGSRFLERITVLEEKIVDEYDAVFKRRLLRFKNAAPYLIKRFASSDFIDYIEDSLFDKRNGIFYVYIQNQSFQSLGSIEDFSVYRSIGNATKRTELKQVARVHITSSSMSFFRSKIESFIAKEYCANAPDNRQYHLDRLLEEFGSPSQE